MKVKELLPKLKANRYTYYNIDIMQKNYFRSLYNALKKHSDKKLMLSSCNSVYHWLNVKNELEYIKKIKAIQCALNGLI